MILIIIIKSLLNLRIGGQKYHIRILFEISLQHIYFIKYLRLRFGFVNAINTYCVLIEFPLPILRL